MHTSNKGKGHPPRLQGWDYSWAGAYFVTFVVKGQLCCLSTIENGKLWLSSWGETVQRCWLELPSQFQSVILDEMVIMPNHVHAVIFLTGKGEKGKDCRAFIHEGLEGQGGRRAFIHEGSERALMNQGPTKHPGSTLRPMMADPRMVLGKVIRAWKAKSAWLIHEVGNLSFAWQSRYHEHVIRNESELDRIRTYVVNNPLEWDTDVENPKST